MSAECLELALLRALASAVAAGFGFVSPAKGLMANLNSSHISAVTEACNKLVMDYHRATLTLTFSSTASFLLLQVNSQTAIMLAITMPPISIMKRPASAATDIWSPPPATSEQAPSPVTSHHFFLIRFTSP